VDTQFSRLFVTYYLSYEKRRLEDCDSVDCVDPDGGTDGTGNYLVHGPRPAVCVKRERKTVEERGCAEKARPPFDFSVHSTIFFLRMFFSELFFVSLHPT